MARKPAAAPRAPTLLVELLTEELPPRSLEALARAFRDSLTHALESAGLRSSESGSRYFATPRRLAVAVSHVRAAASASRERVLGPSAKAPAEAVAGFARKHGATVEQLAKVETPKGPVYALERTLPGAVLAEVLAAKVEAALKELPVTKLMRWGAGEAQFVRPVHGLVMLHGAKRHRGHGARRRRGQAHARPSLHGQGPHRAQERRRLRDAAARRGHGARRLRRAPRGDRAPAATEGKAAEGRAWRDRRPSRRGDRAGRASQRLRRPVRAGLPRRAAGMPDPHHAAEPEVLPAVRRRRPAAAALPHRLEHAARRSAPHRRRQRARGAPAAGGRALLLRPGPQAAARGARAAARQGGLPQQARQPARSRAAHPRSWPA